MSKSLIAVAIDAPFNIHPCYHIVLMRWNGKIVGAIIGLLLGHPYWVVIGIVVGHAYDIGFFQKLFQKSVVRGAQQVQRTFFDSTFSIMGYLAKADGRVTQNEIQIAESIMLQMDLSAEMRREAIRLFNQGKRPDFDLQSALQRLKMAFWQNPNLLRTFLEIQIQVANAEGYISPAKQSALQNICATLGVQGFTFDTYDRQESYDGGQGFQSVDHRLQEAYQTLNINAQASETEIKKAYRRLMGQNHPDKLMSQGLPPEMIKLANERTQKIKSAYETIMKSKKYA